MYIYTLYRKYCMKPLTVKEKTTAEKILLKKNISIDDIESFQFIKYDEYPEAHDRFWGRSLFRIKMKSGTFAYIRIYYNCSKRASALLRYLVSKGIEFSNYNKPYTTENSPKELSDKKYKRCFSEVEVLSILGIYSFIVGLFILNTKNNEPIFTAISGVVFIILGYLMVHTAYAINCQISINNGNLVIANKFKTYTYPIKSILKVNIYIFYTGKRSIKYIEIIDSDYFYHKHQCTGLSRKDTDNLIRSLFSIGIDATNNT